MTGCAHALRRCLFTHSPVRSHRRYQVLMNSSLHDVVAAWQVPNDQAVRGRDDLSAKPARSLAEKEISSCERPLPALRACGNRSCHLDVRGDACSGRPRVHARRQRHGRRRFRHDGVRRAEACGRLQCRRCRRHDPDGVVETATGSANIVPRRNANSLPRPNGSSAGIDALQATNSLTFARSSRGPNTTGDEGLAFLPYAPDGLGYAFATGSHAKLSLVQRGRAAQPRTASIRRASSSADAAAAGGPPHSRRSSAWITP